jgi:hypothetical protein
VSYASRDGTATAGADYTAIAGSLAWADGDSSPKSFAVEILGDTLLEPLENLTVALTAPSGGATLGTDTMTVTIVDDESGPPTDAPLITAATGLDSARPVLYGTTTALVLRVYDNGVLISTRSLTSIGAWRWSTDAPLAPGNHLLTATAQDTGKSESAPSEVVMAVVPDDHGSNSDDGGKRKCGLGGVIGLVAALLLWFRRR